MRVKGIVPVFFVLILILTTAAFFQILRPYFFAILWAAILAIIFHPMKTKLRSMLGDKNGLATLLTIITIFLSVFIPLVIILSSLAIECNDLYDKLQHNQNTLPLMFANIIEHLPSWGRRFLAQHEIFNINDIQQKLSDAAMKGGQYFAGSIMLIGRNTFGVAVGFVIMLYMLFFFLKDGAYLVSLILDALPMSRYVKHYLFIKFAAVSRATVKGTVVVALVQGTLGGIALYFAGVEGSVLWGSLMAFLSLIPAVGSALIWVPVVIYFFFNAAILKGILLIIFFVVVVGIIDNFLRPLLVGKDTKMPDYLVLVTTLGGLDIYGINGFVIGPLIAVIFISCWNLLSGRKNKENAREIDKAFLEEALSHIEEKKE